MTKPSQGRFDGVWGMTTFTAEHLFAWALRYETRIGDPENADAPRWLQRRADRIRRLAVQKERAREATLRRSRRARPSIACRRAAVATWRRKAIALFPELRNDLQRPGCTVYMVFFELLPRVREAHRDGDAERLRRIYGFAQWCSEQKAKDLWNAAGVAFYEHLFDEFPSQWAEFVRWLSPQVVADSWCLWEWRLRPETLAEVKRLLEERRSARHESARRAAERV